MRQHIGVSDGRGGPRGGLQSQITHHNSQITNEFIKFTVRHSNGEYGDHLVGTIVFIMLHGFTSCLEHLFSVFCKRVSDLRFNIVIGAMVVTWSGY